MKRWPLRKMVSLASLELPQVYDRAVYLESVVTCSISQAILSSTNSSWTRMTRMALLIMGSRGVYRYREEVSTGRGERDGFGRLRDVSWVE